MFLPKPVMMIALCLFCGAGESLFSQQYVIQKGDKLTITFWQEPELNTTTVVGQDGRLELPVIGQIQAAGLTSSQLSGRIVEQISRYRIKITQASVVITEFQSNKVYITGEVGSPGTYSFEVIPNLWRTLQEAGGLLASADLEKVAIIRGGEDTGAVIQVDVTKYFEQGELANLPKLQGGDTVHVPRVASVRSGNDAPSSPFVSKNEIYIAGEVASPGRYNLEANTDVLEALILAGGPTASADLSDVKVLTRWQGKNGMVKVDLKKYLDNSEPMPVALKPGDRIFVPRKASSGVPVFIVTNILVPVITSATVLLLINSIR